MNDRVSSTRKKVLLWLASAVAASVVGVLVGRFFELGPFSAPPEIHITQFSLTNEKGLEHLPRYAPFRTLAEELTRADVVLYNAGSRTAVEIESFPRNQGIQ